MTKKQKLIADIHRHLNSYSFAELDALWCDIFPLSDEHGLVAVADLCRYGKSLMPHFKQARKKAAKR
jgi:hypothetical protein